MERHFGYVCLHSGGMCAQQPVAAQFGASRGTLSNLMASVEAAHLIYRCAPTDTGGEKSLKPRGKGYLADPCIRGAVLPRGEEALTETAEAGLDVGTAVHRHVHAL